MTAVALHSLSRHFDTVCAVDGVDLTIESGELFFLIGPSGCGKTTLLRMIAGFIEPTAGEILFDGRSVARLPANQRNVGMVFQNYALWPHMSVYENIAFGLNARKVRGREQRRRVEESLEMVQLHAMADRLPAQLSGGQQQRVALARALVIKPAVLLLDEPLSNLDARLRLDMRSSIQHICRQARTTTIYVTHDQKEALSMADRVAVMHNGRIEQVGQPETMYDRPASCFVADFLGETNVLPGRVVGREGDHIVVETAIGRLLAQASGGGNPSDGESASDGDVPSGAVLCSIRPERIHVRPVASESERPRNEQPNRFPGRVRSRVFLGDTAQYEIELATNIAIKHVCTPPRNGMAGQRVDGRTAGDGIEIVIDPADVIVLADVESHRDRLRVIAAQ